MQFVSSWLGAWSSVSLVYFRRRGSTARLPMITDCVICAGCKSCLSGSPYERGFAEGLAKHSASASGARGSTTGANGSTSGSAAGALPERKWEHHGGSRGHRGSTGGSTTRAQRDGPGRAGDQSPSYRTMIENQCHCCCGNFWLTICADNTVRPSHRRC